MVRIGRVIEVSSSLVQGEHEAHDYRRVCDEQEKWGSVPPAPGRSPDKITARIGRSPWVSVPVRADSNGQVV